MSEVQILRVGKITRKQGLTAAARHNLREILREQGKNSHIDSTKSGCNIILEGTDNSAGIAERALALINEANIKSLRKDAVWAVEYLFSLSPQSKISVVDYFRDCCDWIAAYTGCPILSAIIHLDETCPHLHVLVLPIVDGRMNGARLVGFKPELAALKAAHYQAVGIRYGLRREGTLSSAQKKEIAAEIIDQLTKNPALLRLPDVKRALNQLLSKAPTELKAILGIPDPQPEHPKKTFVGIMTSPGKGHRFHYEV